DDSGGSRITQDRHLGGGRTTMHDRNAIKDIQMNAINDIKMRENDDVVLDRLRQACAARIEDPDAHHDLDRLYDLRDEALSRGLPLPSSCPMDSAGAA
ncbi:MAG: hypothetical protein ABIW80_16430, partial [Lapillicoccus sp.]